MLVLKNQDDVRFHEVNRSIKTDMAKHLVKFFDDLQEELEFLSPDTYSVEDSSQVVILDKNDNIRDLSDVGLNKADKGLLGCIPEWFEVVSLDGNEYYRFLVLYNDTFGSVFYCPVGIFDDEVEAWLQEKEKRYGAF